MKTIAVRTAERECFVDITEQVRGEVRASSVKSGICVVFSPHTTAGVTINENADPDVVRDLLQKYRRIAPKSDGYRHSEGNSDAHVKTSMVGCSQTLIIENGDIALGTWQSIYFCEFDGARNRRVFVQCVGHA